MNPPDVTIIQCWPRLLSHKEAATYLGVSEAQLIVIARLYPHRMRTLNLNPNGHVKFDREDLDAYVEWRKTVGVERVA